MADDLVEFLRARIDEEAAVAESAGGLSERWETSGDGDVYDGPTPIAVGPRGGGLYDVGAHIARHDPARVLADVAAKRRIVELHALDVRTRPAQFSEATGDLLHDVEYEVTCDTCGWASQDPTSGCGTLRLLAIPYADHPDYRETWTLPYYEPQAWGVGAITADRLNSIDQR